MMMVMMMMMCVMRVCGSGNVYLLGNVMILFTHIRVKF